MFADTAKIVVTTGIAIVIFGLLLMASDKYGTWGWINWLGHLPLDIKIERGNFRFYFPLGTSVVLSLLFSLLLFFLNKVIR
ncbi:MAG: DUF2905 domain-containing protein [Chlorobiaceae bacterium]|nr:DUF2905 domain-containing protein [Chlorobiaceae bacterium]NTV16019.1 DUF2905 domain-containing protein [Chlorobiaceae bacterium]